MKGRGRSFKVPEVVDPCSDPVPPQLRALIGLPGAVMLAGPDFDLFPPLSFPSLGQW